MGSLNLGFSPAMGLGSGGRPLPERMARASPPSLLRDRSLLRLQRRLWCPVGPPRWPSRRPTLKTKRLSSGLSCSATISPDGGRGLDVSGEWMTCVLHTEHMCMTLSRRLPLGHRGPCTVFSVPLSPWEWADPKPKTTLLSERNPTEMGLSALSFGAHDSVL